MQPLLLVATALSLGLAALMGVLLWRNTREQQRRSDARVAVLESELYDVMPETGLVDNVRRRPHPGLLIAAAGICVFGAVALLAGVLSGSGAAQARSSDSSRPVTADEVKMP